MATGYEQIDSLEKQQNQILDDSMVKQQDIINKQTQMNIDQLQRQQDKVDESATKTNRALYTEYRKNNNPYGAKAESLGSQGLGNSGYAESTQTNLYNTYQKNVTDTMNNARTLKADFDFQISQARQSGDIAMAQNALEIYNQKLQLLTQNYELRNNREQFLYQQQRDKVADNQWQKQFEYNKYVDDRNYNYQKNIDDRNYNYQVGRDKVTDNQWQKQFDYNRYSDDRNYNYQVGRDKVTDNQWQQQFDYNRYSDDRNYNYQKSVDDRNYRYQVGRDKVSDSQWEKEYALSKKASASASKRSSKRKSSSRSTSGYTITNNSSNNSTSNSNKYTAKDILSKMGIVQGPTQNGNGVQKVIDGISGKEFSSPAELLKYYGL